MRLTHRRWRRLTLAVVVVAAVEALSTIAAVVSMTRRGIPQDIAAQRLLLTRWLVSPLLSINTRLAAYTGGRQRYLGDLDADSPERIEVVVPDALLGYRLGRNITGFENIGLGDQHGFVWVTNDEGFVSLGERDFHYGLDRPEQRERVIIVGGSTVIGWGAGAPDRSLPARVHALLAADDPPRYEVINAGVPGYDSGQEFLYVASELMAFNPDLLIVYDGWNDESSAEREPSSHQADAGANPLRTPEHRLIEERFTAGYSVSGSAGLFAGIIAARIRAAVHHTGTYRLMKRVTRPRVRRVFPDPPTPMPAYDPARVARYEENLTNMLNLAARHGARVALFLQPILGIDGAAPADPSTAARRAFYADARPMFTRLRERYQRPAQVCIEDLSRVLEGAGDTNYVDSGHLSGRGNEVMAAEIVRRLGICGVLARARF